MSKHTKEPWKVTGGRDLRLPLLINNVETCTDIAEVLQEPASSRHFERVANAARIVACVNACEGYRPEMVREAIEMLQSIVKTCPETLRALRIDAAKTVAMLEEK